MHNEGIIPDIQSLIKAVIEANDRFFGQVWWRGQRNKEWNLAPSVARLPHIARSEQSLIARFKHKAPSRHPHVPNTDDYPGWLFLMQHYRLPTRLLDWTESPLIACYFTSEIDPAAKEYPDKIHDTDGALFALSPYALNEKQVGDRVLLLPNDPLPSVLIKSAFDKSAKDREEILAIRPSEVDSRLMVQLSVFTLHGTRKLLEDNPAHEDFILKFTIPSDSKASLREQLKHLGIRESSIFPDLEHLAKDVASTRFKYYAIRNGFASDIPLENYTGECDT